MPPSPEPAVDRRAALKDRHRRAIVEAAAALIDERGSTDFTVDQLAARADVSRRTVFNHFASVDEIVIAVCTSTLVTLVERFEHGGPDAVTARGDALSVFDEVADAVRGVDLVGPMAYVTQVLGGEDPTASARPALVLLRSLTDVSQRLIAEILRRHPDTDELTVHLFVASLMSGLVAIHRHWVEATGAADDDASRQVWGHLVDRLLDATRRGYGPGSTPGF